MEDVEYTFRGSPLRRHIVHTDSLGYSFTEDYASTYDHEERLLNERHSLNGADSVTVVSNTYDSLGRLASNGRAGNAQLTTQYAYNIRSWTTGINSPYFSETLYYNTPRPGSASAVQWGGNISSMAWDTTKAYDYTYDGLSRLTGASYAGNSANSRQYSYDAHGNMTGLTEGTTPHSYTYTGNHLSGSQYDYNGNTTSDSGTGIVSARYNVLNLPDEIIKSDGDTVRYVYSAAGMKLRERVIPQSSSGTTTRTDYVGNLVYRNGLLGRILVDGGSVVAKDSTLTPTYEFSFTDHLGSVRALVSDGDSLYRRTEYGPYGEVLCEDGSSQSGSPGGGGGDDGGEVIEVGDDEEEEPGGRGTRSVGIIQTYVYNPYRFGGKERLDVGGLDLYDFGARHYTPALPRWLTMDPLAEKYNGVSPYVYCVGNPVNLVDPKGTAIVIIYGKDRDKAFTYRGPQDDLKIPDSKYVRAVIHAYKYNKTNWEKAGYKDMCPSTELVEGDLKVYVYQSMTEHDKYERQNGGRQTIIWNPFEGTKTTNGTILSPATVFCHEADHAVSDGTNAKQHDDRVATKREKYDNDEEYRVITGSEQNMARANGEIKAGQVTRRDHSGETVLTTGVTTTEILKDNNR